MFLYSAAVRQRSDGRSSTNEGRMLHLLLKTRVHSLVPRLACLGLLLIVMATSGCVQRRLQVRSQPEGAFLTIDNQPIGYTPVSVPFTYYGTRDVQLEKDGYKTIKVQQRVDAPWYQWVPISFFAEHFSPREIRDERLLEFQMEPKSQVNENLLRERANQLRQDVQRGTVTAPIDH